MCTCRVAVASAAVAAVETGAAAAVGVERLSDCFAVGALGASFGTDACAHDENGMGPNSTSAAELMRNSIYSLWIQAWLGCETIKASI